MSAKRRLDEILVARGLATSRSQARALILAGRVMCGETRLDKPGTRCAEEIDLIVRPGRRFVSRGGHKLAAALTRFGIDPRGASALDVGASTGGFTQVLLEAGCTRVVALDVGRGQLDWGLRNDPRVTLLEGVNARYLLPEQLPERPELAVIDVSFISLRLVLPAIADCLARGGRIVALVKPQFEVGRSDVGRGGIVRDPLLHRRVLVTVSQLAAERDWGLAGICASPLRGADGNREFFVHLVPGSAGASPGEIEQQIEAALDERPEDTT